MNRDPNRIDVIIAVLREVWKQSPQQRLGELLVNIDTRSSTPDLFMLEDDRLLKILEQIFEQNQLAIAKEKGEKS